MNFLPSLNQKEFASIALVAFSLAMVFVSQSNCDAQEPNDEPALVADKVEKKVIREPVHRVPKIASNTGIMAISSVGLSTIADPPSPAKNSGKNIPDNRSIEVENKTPAVLPRAVKTISEPALANSAPTPSVNSMVPAQPASMTKAPHPLDDALETARKGLVHIQTNIKDYSAILVKRERVNGTLLKPEYAQVKIRSERVAQDGSHVPFSIYMKFIKPRACAGREVIWVKGRNENKICVHEGSGLISLKRFNLEPTSWLAMKGQRYPIYEAGVENLVAKLIEKAERDRAAGHCDVVYRDGVHINDRECSVIEVTHPEQRAPYDFNVAKVFIDNELKLPIRYQAHIWPESGSTKPQLLEEYTYLNVKVNQGFTDQDFNPDNPLYKYPN